MIFDKFEIKFRFIIRLVAC